MAFTRQELADQAAALAAQGVCMPCGSGRKGAKGPGGRWNPTRLTR